jgi:DNA repair protein RecO (recombination protein O)
MSSFKTQALVIKSIDWKDTSRIVSLYTREAGKMKVIAKGARRIKSSYAGMLETMNLVEAVIYVSEKRQIQILGELALENGFAGIKKDYDRTGRVYAIFELADHFLQDGERDPVFFDFLLTLLREITEIKDSRIVFWYFLLKLGSYLGFRMDLGRCAGCARELGEEESFFSLSHDGLTCAACQTGISNGWPLPAAAKAFLVRLQKTPHKRLSKTVFAEPGRFPYTDFLLSYLRHHTGENLELFSLKIFK